MQNRTHHASPSATSIYTYTHDTTVGTGKKSQYVPKQKNLQVPSFQFHNGFVVRVYANGGMVVAVVVIGSHSLLVVYLYYELRS